VIVAFIDASKVLFGIEPICRVLRDHNLPIAPSTYYAFKKRPPSARAVSDERLVPIVKAVHEDNFGVSGARKLWHAFRRQGERVGRDQVARLMRLANVRGVSRRKRVRLSPPSPPEVRSPDLVRLEWFRDAPDLVWVADFTHVHTRDGWMYVSFLQNASSRRILGFAVAASKTVELVTRTLLQAVTIRKRLDATFIPDGIIVHSDAGSQYTSWRSPRSSWTSASPVVSAAWERPTTTPSSRAPSASTGPSSCTGERPPGTPGRSSSSPRPAGWPGSTATGCTRCSGTSRPSRSRQRTFTSKACRGRLRESRASTKTRAIHNDVCDDPRDRARNDPAHASHMVYVLSALP
jgi:hypothetical protein